MTGTLFLALAAAPIDLTTLPPDISGPAIGYEMCLLGVAEAIAKASEQPPKAFEIAQRSCQKDHDHLDIKIDNYFIERSIDAGRHFTDADFQEAEKVRQALTNRANLVFEADLKAFRRE